MAGASFQTVIGGKDAKNVVVDFALGQIKALGKTSFSMLGGANPSRDYFWDMGIGLYKTEAKNMMPK